MEPEGSLPHSQVPTTCLYPEPARSSLYPHTPLPEDPSKYYPPIYASFFQVVSFPQISHQNPVYTSLIHKRYMPRPSLFSILLPEQYWVRSTDHLAPRYVVFSTPLLPRPS